MADLETLKKLRADGRSLREIAAQVGLSHEQVRQLLLQAGVKFDVTYKGTLERLLLRRQNKAKPRRFPDDHIRAIYGCTWEELTSIQGDKILTHREGKARTYLIHKYGVLEQGQKWKLTFPQWWKLWELEFATRRKKRLIMALIDPSQPAAVGNVEIITRSERMRRYHRG